jgi:hypothetical protein
VVIWYIFSCFGILYQEKSGNPVSVNVSTFSYRHVASAQVGTNKVRKTKKWADPRNETKDARVPTNDISMYLTF